MVTAYWGVTRELGLAWPDTISGWLLLLSYVILFLVLLILGRRSFSRLSAKKWILLCGLSGLALFFSQLLPWQVPSWLANMWPNYDGGSEAVTVALLSAVPYLLAAALLGPAPALIVGFFTGLGHTLGLTQQPYTPFQFAFAAWLAAQLMQQSYQGRFYAWLRLPLVSGVIGQTSAALCAALIAFAGSSDLLAAVDAALATFQMIFWPLLLEGLVGGALVTILLKGMAQWLPQRQIVPSPSQRSVRRYLLTNFLLFGSTMLLLSALFVFALSLFLSSRLLVTQMAANGNTAAARLEEYRAGLEHALSQSGKDEELARGDKSNTTRALGRLYRNAAHFQRVMLVDQELSVIDSYPAAESGMILAAPEQEAVLRAVRDGLATPVVAEIPGQGQMLSIIMPLERRQGQPPAALVGRVPVAKLANLLDDLLLAGGSGHVIDRQEQVFAAASRSGAPAGWLSPEANGAQSIFVPAYLGGKAYLMENSHLARDIYYLSPPSGNAWRVALTVPHKFVLNQALAGTLLVFLMLLGVTAVFYTRLSSYGQHLVGPISDLAQASRSIAAGGNLTTRVDVDRQDEVGELSRAFGGMQRALKGRLDELSLLLAVSQDISTSIDINQSMPVILQGAVRGTGAAGARAVIVNPSGRVPLTFAEGPAGEELAAFDRALMKALPGRKELVLSSSSQMSQLFGPAAEASPVKALLAISLQSQNKYQGVFFLGYWQPREFGSSEKDLLRTLAGQATVLVDNAHLFAKAEKGRRRLKALLTSISEAVIVTDQTERVSLLNSAMEQAFQLSAGHAIGRPVSDVIQAPLLLKALMQPDASRRNLEIKGKDGRTYYANVSTIVGRDGKISGHVAVLHDVTKLKEVDRLKSEFVRNVSHDIKTPLTVISSAASQLAMIDNLSAEQREFTDNILSSVHRMVNLVDNLLDLGRLEDGIALQYETFEVGTFLAELADEHWLYAHNSGVSLRIKVEEDLPPIRADRAWISQAIANLLTNGFKYAPNSGEMILSAVRIGENVVIGLHDRGPGIAEQDQMHLFEKFYRVKRHGTGKAKGTGLGLAIVKTVAERHGGQVWCESVLGAGSVFFISLPVAGRGS